MSVKVMGLVWDLDLPQNEKFILLAYADHADHNGQDIYPSTGLIARKTGYSKRTVQRVTAALVQKGWLIHTGTGPKGTNRYRIPIPAEGGDNLSSPHDADDGEGVPLAPAGGDISTAGGDIAVSPEPSLEPSLKEPSLNHPPPRESKRARAVEKRQEEEEAPRLSTRLSTGLQTAGVFRELWPEIAASGRPEPEILALLAWAEDSETDTPGALFVSRFRSGADPPAKYFEPANECCGGRGKHVDSCPGSYTNGNLSHLIEH